MSQGPKATSSPKIQCSFCGTEESEETKGKFVAGPTVFVCRGCVDMLIEIFCDMDPKWGEAKIEQIKEKLKSGKSTFLQGTIQKSK